MSKTKLIIKREYLSRVKKKSFIIMTFLTPLLLTGLMIIPTWIMTMKDKNEKTLAVVDYTGLYEDIIKDSETLKFDFIPQNEEAALRSNFKKSDYYAFLIISEDLIENPNAIQMFSDAAITMDIKEYVSRSLKEYLKEEKLKSFDIEGFDEALAEINKITVNISTLKLSEDGTVKQSSTEAAMLISIFFAMFSYFFIFMYGSQVFTGVMQEKSNRIVEVLISSVKPLELMMGKIIGIAMVAVTQFFMWIVITLIFVSIAMNFLAPKMDAEIIAQMVQTDTTRMPNINTMPNVDEAMNDAGFQMDNLIEIVKSFNPVKTMLLFLFYFICGYLIYAALFAAVGSAVDNETDSQQFMMPITIPVIIAMFIAISAFRNPASSVVFWGSLIPFTSPIVMMARISFGVPNWEIFLSMALLIIGILFTIWFAARIYKTGILMYGKKVDFKEIWKWFMYAGK